MSRSWAIVSTRQMEETPLPNRRITYLPLLNAANRPAINQGDIFMNQDMFTTNGAGRRQTWFEVDGVTGNDSWGRQTIFTNIPLTAVQEMTVLENAFSAEYGGSTGSAVNIVTKSRRQPVSRRIMELWRPSATEAALSGFTTDQRDERQRYRQRHSGPRRAASCPGPIGKRQTHFFAAGEYSRENRASPIISPVAPGAFIGHYRGWLGFLRIDHQINDRKQSVFPQRSRTDSTTPIRTESWAETVCPRVDRVFHRRTYSEELGETAVISPTLVNSVRAAISARLADHGIRSGDIWHAVLGADLDRRDIYHRGLRNRRC